MPPADSMNDDFDFAGADGGDIDPPVLKVGEEKEIGTQGLKKKLLKEGEGWNTPEVGDEVQGTTRSLFFFFLNWIFLFQKLINVCETLLMYILYWACHLS